MASVCGSNGVVCEDPSRERVRPLRPATEAGLIAAKNHLKTPAEGGAGRGFANKVIVLLTDGIPNAWMTSNTDIENYIVAMSEGPKS